MSTSKKTFAVIVAAGRGARAGEGGPKQYRDLAGEAVLSRTLRAFLDHPEVDFVRVIIHADDSALYRDAVSAIAASPKLMAPVLGGAERQDSVRLGLESLAPEKPDLVLIHDAARPFVDAPSVSRVLKALENSPGAIAALPVFDTIKKAGKKTGKIAGGGASPEIVDTIPRESLWRAQTPQGFVFETILKAHKKAQGEQLTDDAAVAEREGLAVALVLGSPDNMKITQAEDFGMAESLLGRNADMWEFRTGHGFDVHAFEHGEAVTLCAVDIPHGQKLKGHSDADVAIHALTDAVLGAIGAGDIGDHFPPSDPQWKGAPSRVFLEKARDLTLSMNGQITHCDITIICEAPKIGPHRGAMRDALSKIIKISPERISVKATTTEELGFTGRREGISAMATATVRLPMSEK